MVFERINLHGHLLDENTLAKVLSILENHHVQFKVRKLRIGEQTEESSIIELDLWAPDQAAMSAALEECIPYGAAVNLQDAVLVAADVDGVWPEGFYSTTNFTTHVRVEGQWIEVERIEMDTAIRVWQEESRWRAETCPMHQVKTGDRFVVGMPGVKVVPTEEEERDDEEFRFMSSEVSSERPKSRMIAHCAEAMKLAREAGHKILLVGGPAIVHSGNAWVLESLIHKGWVDVLFAGNALAAHDIEASMLGTSLGIDIDSGYSVPHGHTHHLRAINAVRRAGSIAAAVQAGLIKSGVMHACVVKPIPFVLCGSIRDDGPLPDVITDNVKAQDEMRKYTQDVGVALMLATMLHSIATGNMLPATVKTYCVDSDADTVIKLTDRGTHQAIGLVTDVEFFLQRLARELGVI